MVRVTVKQSGKTDIFARSLVKLNLDRILRSYGDRGVKALAANTPVDTGLTASSWGYTYEKTEKGCSLTWTNSNTANGTPIVIFIQYGHATASGGYVQGVDIVNSALKPIFDKLAEELWMEVTRR